MMSEGYGISWVKFTNHEKNILVASSKDNVHSVYYWSLHDNVILAKFLGHESSIVSIDVNSCFSYFVTVANDESAIIWDFNKVEPVAEFSECQAAWNDNTGKVLACSHSPKTSDQNAIYLYNVEEEIFEKSFSSLFLQEDKDIGQIKRMKFSYDGKFIMCIDSKSNLFIVDAYEGGIISKLSNAYDDVIVSPLVADITPCSQYVVIGFNKKWSIWDWNNNKEYSLTDIHAKHIKAIRFNTEFWMFSSGWQNLVIWTLDLPESSDF